MDWSQLLSNVVVAVVAAVALVLHALQCEVSYRLDFIWKLQANGMYFTASCIITRLGHETGAHLVK